MKSILNGYFYGTKNELRGVVVLFCLIFLVVIIQFTVLKIDTDTTTVDNEAFQEKVTALVAMNKMKSTPIRSNLDRATAQKNLFYFNPNTASKADFEKLGLSARTAQSIINYRNKGGRFFKPQDFKKIYTLTDADFERLAPYIDLPKSNFGESQNAIVTENREEVVAELFPFNPNTANKADFKRLGLSGRTAQSIINYRNKGGKFSKPDDFKKIYTLSEDDFERLKPYIVLPKKTDQLAENTEEDESHIMGFAQAATPKKEYIQKSSTVKVDVNVATIEDFQQLKGIGKGYAKRIITYRNQLGGFITTSQLKEVFGFPKETYEAIEKQLVIDSKAVSKININTATYKELVQHPYIDSKRANAIVKYRQQHGNFKSVGDLAKIYAIPKSTLSKIKPYLKV